MRRLSSLHRSESAISNQVHSRCPQSPRKLQYLSLLEKKCSTIKQLKQIHAQVITTGLFRFTFVVSRILAFATLSRSCNLDYAHLIFDRIALPTIFNWNTMIRGYCSSSNPGTGLWFYKEMLSSGLNPNQHTHPFVLKASAGLSCLIMGKSVHAHSVKFGFEFDLYVASALIFMYSRCGDVMLARRVFDKSPNRNVASWASLISGYCGCGLLEDARRVFDEMPGKNAVAWSAMVTGYVRNGFSSEAVQVFNELRRDNVKPNQSMLVGVLSACAQIGAIDEGKWVHSYVEDSNLGYGLEIGTALVNFYAKVGCVGAAREVFDSMQEKDVMAWTAMIMGLAVHGLIDETIGLFSKMEESYIQPNAVTFVGLLSACNHGGLVEEGWYYFNLMRNKYGISPTIEHYGCIVDLMSRAGLLVDAENLINSMPMKPDGIIWGALLNGCMIHGCAELGERVGKYLIELDPDHSGRYVLLANLYAAVGDWDGVRSTRKRMRERNVAIVPGCSFIEINGIIDRFLVDDKSHPQSARIYDTLNALNRGLRSFCHEDCEIP